MATLSSQDKPIGMDEPVAANPFEYRQPSAFAVDTIILIRDECKTLYKMLTDLPECRERSMAMTKLEEVSMWANKAIAFYVR